MSNIGYTPGTGALVRADLVGGDLVQWMKMTVGAADTATPLTFGSALSAASLPVVIASDQGAIPVSGSFSVTGGATEAGQTDGNASLTSIDGKTPALVSGRVPVDGSGVTQPISGTVNLGTLNGAATAALQSTGNTSLSNIDGKLPALSSGRVPVDGSGVTQPVSGSVSLTGTLPAFAANPTVVSIPTPATTSGAHSTAYTALSAASTTPVQIKGTATNIGSINIRNNSAATRWVKIFLLPSASVTMGTTTPSFNIGVAAGATRDLFYPQGQRGGTGFTWSVTTGQALLDNTAGAAGDIEINAGYL